MVEPVVDPLMPGYRWYLLADPETAPVFVYGFLEGATGPIQGVDGIEISVVFDFGVQSGVGTSRGTFATLLASRPCSGQRSQGRTTLTER